MVQTNNATYMGTGQVEQQFAIARLRALETGRVVVVAATNGVSGVIGADGEVLQRAPVRETAVLEADVAQHEGVTPGIRWGGAVQWLLVAGALLAQVGVSVLARRRRAELRRRRRRSRPRGRVSAGDAVDRPARRPHGHGGPDLQRGREPGVDRRSVLLAAVPEPTCSSSTTPRPTARAARRRPGGRATSGSACAPAPRRPGSARRTSHGFARRAGAAATTSSARWTPTAPTSREQLPALLAALEDADLVIGSRWVPGGSVTNWPRWREALSRGGNLYARLALGVTVRDITAGFRLFRRSALQELDLAHVASDGYCFQADLAWRTLEHGLRVVEVPIEFLERERGVSKMNGRVAAESLRRITRWGAEHRATQARDVLWRQRSRTVAARHRDRPGA